LERGYPPGPLYREIFSRVLDARLDGLVHSPADEIEWISRHFPPASH